jgi:hypothetical protein
VKVEFIDAKTDDAQGPVSEDQLPSLNNGAHRSASSPPRNAV